MNRAQFQIENSSVITLLQDYAEAIEGIENIVVGSVSLIAHTQSVHYYRNIKDIDVLVNLGDKAKFEDRLIKFGYKKSSFIPLIGILFSRNNARFIKKGLPDLDVSYLKIKRSADSVELMKSFFKVLLPNSAVVTTDLFGIEISTFSVEATKLSKQILNRTIGRVVQKGKAKRALDMENLDKQMNFEVYRTLIENVRFQIGKTTHKLPTFLYK